MKNINTYGTATLLVIALLFSSCTQLSKTEKGAATGAGAGAIVGGVLGKAVGKTAKGAVLGAVIGGTAGAVIGQKMDKQADVLEEELKDADVQRVGEGIIVSFDSGILFDFDSDELKQSAKSNLLQLVESLKANSGTELLIVGHTDSKGSSDYNLSLSRERASAAANYLSVNGISPSRIKRDGQGESEPVADNSTEAGREQNRRVEVAIFASEAAKNDAINQTKG